MTRRNRNVTNWVHDTHLEGGKIGVVEHKPHVVVGGIATDGLKSVQLRSRSNGVNEISARTRNRLQWEETRMENENWEWECEMGM